MALKAIFFDMDGTLTPSRSQISKPMAKALSKLKQIIVVVSGAEASQIRTQVGDKHYILAQNGNDASYQGEHLWYSPLSPNEKEQVRAYLTRVVGGIRKDKFDDRGAQISYSFVGHNAPRDLKAAYDPTGQLRSQFLSEYPFNVPGVEVKIGGTTCLDFFKQGHTKGYNVARFMHDFNLDPEECLYVGDALFPGGNDESVIGICPTNSVGGPDETLALIQSL